MLHLSSNSKAALPARAILTIVTGAALVQCVAVPDGDIRAVAGQSFRKRGDGDSILPTDVPPNCATACAPYVTKLEACKSKSAEPGSRERLGCECESTMFEAWVSCGLCYPETYDTQDRKMMGVVMDAASRCEAVSMPVVVDMARIPGGPLPSAATEPPSAAPSVTGAQAAVANTDATGTSRLDTMHGDDEHAGAGGTGVSGASPANANTATGTSGIASGSASSGDEPSTTNTSNSAGFKVGVQNVLALSIAVLVATAAI